MALGGPWRQQRPAPLSRTRGATSRPLAYPQTVAAAPAAASHVGRTSTARAAAITSMRLAAGSTSVVADIAAQVASKQRSAVEVTTSYLRQLRSVEDRLGSFLAVDEAHALAQACVCACCARVARPAMACDCVPQQQQQQQQRRAKTVRACARAQQWV